MSLVTAPKKPTEPPKPGDRRRAPMPQPKMPQVDPAEMAAVFKAAQGKSPGEAAFRHMIKKFMQYNIHFAKAKAAKEGITVAEVEELTYFGYMVMATQHPDTIEEMTGVTLSDDKRAKLGELMRSHNQKFTKELKGLVAQNASEDDRWKLIHQAQANYKDELFGLTGLNAETFDDLLAGDLSKTGSPGAAKYPDKVTPRPYVDTDQPRPSAPR